MYIPMNPIIYARIGSSSYEALIQGNQSSSSYET